MHMMPFILTALTFLTTAAVMPFIITFAAKRGFLDVPNGDGLKVHKLPIPLFGGIGIFVGFVGPLVFLSATAPDSGSLLGVLVGCLMLLSLGVWDDLKNIKPIVRLGGQLLVSGITIYSGLTIHTFTLAALAVPLTVMCILGAINTVNLFDGLDGLAGGTVAISLMGFAVLLYWKGNFVYMLLALSVLGSVLAFLMYNFNPARIFMGDNGSTALGYVLSVLAITASSKSNDYKSFILSLLIIGLPILDTALAIVRRLLQGRPIFLGDRSHLYDQLMDKGFSVKKTVFICYALQTIFVSGALYWFLP